MSPLLQICTIKQSWDEPPWTEEVHANDILTHYKELKEIKTRNQLANSNSPLVLPLARNLQDLQNQMFNGRKLMHVEGFRYAQSELDEKSGDSSEGGVVHEREREHFSFKTVIQIYQEVGHSICEVIQRSLARSNRKYRLLAAKALSILVNVRVVVGQLPESTGEAEIRELHERALEIDPRLTDELLVNSSSAPKALKDTREVIKTFLLSPIALQEAWFLEVDSGSGSKLLPSLRYRELRFSTKSKLTQVSMMNSNFCD